MRPEIFDFVTSRLPTSVEEERQIKKEKTIRKKGVAMREKRARAATLPPLPTTSVTQKSPPPATAPTEMSDELYWSDTPNANVFGCDKSVSSAHNDDAFSVWPSPAPTGFARVDATDTTLNSTVELWRR